MPDFGLYGMGRPQGCKLVHTKAMLYQGVENVENVTLRQMYSHCIFCRLHNNVHCMTTLFIMVKMSKHKLCCNTQAKFFRRWFVCRQFRDAFKIEPLLSRMLALAGSLSTQNPPSLLHWMQSHGSLVQILAKHARGPHPSEWCCALIPCWGWLPVLWRIGSLLNQGTRVQYHSQG